MSPRTLRLVLAAGLAGLTAAAFLPVLRAEFLVVDDGVTVWKNPGVLGGLSLDGLVWAFTTQHFAMWHPLTWLSHQADVTLFGLNPTGHHAVSLALHAGAVVLAFLALERMTSAPWRSALAAALFGLHPLRVESVAWVAERKDVLCAFFCLLTVLVYVGWTQRRTTAQAALVVAAFTLACLSKPMAVTLPFALLLLDAWPLQRTDAWTRRVVEKAPLFALSALTAVMMLRTQDAGAPGGDFAQRPLGERLLQVPVVYAQSLRREVWPADLAFLYPYRVPSALEVVGALALLAALLGGAAVLWKRTRAPLVGLLWFLGVMFPTAGLVRVGGGAQFTADRYTYLPSLGLALGLVFALPAVTAPRLTRLVAAVWGAVLLSLVGLTLTQTTTWRTSETLFARSLEVEPDNAWVLGALGLYELNHGRAGDAVAHLGRAVDLAPAADGFTRSNLALALARTGRLGPAVEQAAIATAQARDDPYVAVNHARVLLAAERAAEAVPLLERVAKAPPYDVSVESDLGLALAFSGRTDEGLARLRARVHAAPTDAPAHVNLALVLARLGRFAEAKQALERALELTPGDARTQALLQRVNADLAGPAR